MSAEADDTAPSLRHYALAKQEVAALIRAANRLFQAQSTPAVAEQCQTLLVQLAEDRFNLAVVGQFKRGKSTLMNAVLGRNLLPTGLLPLTSAITTLCYGSTERVVLRREGGTLEQEIPVAQLTDFITERGNPGNEKRLLEARVELPLPFLRRGLHFIDTPGIGSARHENTATTYAFLPQMNAVIFVTSIEAPLSEAEEHFLADLRGQVRLLFVVVNKVDLLGDTEREEVFGYLQPRVERLLGTEQVQLSPLSARDSLAAKLSNDAARLHQSGLAPFEQTLTTFLVEQQGRAFLISLLDRSLRLFTEERLMLASGVPGVQIEPSGPACELQQKMETLRASLLEGTPLPETHTVVEPTAADSRMLTQVIIDSRAPARSTGGRSTHARGRTCPICAAQGQALFAFFAQWQYLLATDAAAQRAFAAEHGFCPIHTWQFQEMASPQGISDGYAPLIEALAGKLSELIERSPEQAAEALAALLTTTATCPACRVVRETATERIAELLAHLATVEGRANYASSAGLCLPHVQEALACLNGHVEETSEQNTGAEFLLREHVRRLADLAEDLRSYALKRDALRRGLLHQEELRIVCAERVQHTGFVALLLPGCCAERTGRALPEQRPAFLAE
jgi:GTP-binding protein EngB required for normal cell division